MDFFPKIVLAVFIAAPISVGAQNVDYSKGNSNPYATYQYGSQDYFDRNMTNPKTIAQDNTMSCWDKAGVVYKIDPWLLMSIAYVESRFNPNAINTSNKNKTTDIGMMQINSFWLPTLSKYGIQKQDLLNPCTSIFVGAWILAQNIRQYGYTKTAIGAYNARNPTIRIQYANKVYDAYAMLTRKYAR